MNFSLIKWGAALLVTLLGVYFAANLKVGENALDMLPTPALQGDLVLFEELGLINRVILSLEVTGEPARSEVQQAIESLGEQIAATKVFSQVTYRLPEGYQISIMASLWSALPFLLDEHDLERIDQRLDKEQLDATMTADFMLLNSLAGLAMKDQLRRDPLGLSKFLLEKLERLRGGFAVQIDNGFFVSQDGKNYLLWAESVLPLTNSRKAREVQIELDRVLAKQPPTLKARIIGPLAHTLANADTVEHDLKTLLPIAMVVLLGLLLFLLRDPWGLPVILVPFLAAPVAVAGIALLYDEVSAMALGFGIVLLGIAVDFSVHIFFAARGPESTVAMQRLRGPLAMAATTTIGVFAVLLFSDVPAHRQMATLAIIGILWALCLAWFLVPDFVRRGRQGKLSPIVIWMSNVLKIGRRHGKFAVGVWLCLLVVGLLVWPQLRYNGDLKGLDVGSATIKADEEQFHAAWGKGGEQAFVVAVADTLEAALNLNDQVDAGLMTLDLHGYQSVAPLVPGPVRAKKNHEAWQRFWQERYETMAKNLEEAAGRAGFAAGAFAPFLNWLRLEPSSLDYDALLQGPLKPMLSSLVRVADRSQGAQADVPNDFIVATVMSEGGDNLQVLEKISSLLPRARVVSNAAWRLKVERLLRLDILRLSLSAGLLIIILVWCFYRQPRVVLAVLAPVLAALAAMAFFDYCTSRDLNLMHVLMGIMVIGLSVDYGIFVVSGHGREIPAQTAAAVTVCAISTLTGFGVLAFATHPALHALGATVLAGIGAAWPTALWVSPLFLREKG